MFFIEIIFLLLYITIQYCTVLYHTVEAVFWLLSIFIIFNNNFSPHSAALAGLKITYGIQTFTPGQRSLALIYSRKPQTMAWISLNTRVTYFIDHKLWRQPNLIRQSNQLGQLECFSSNEADNDHIYCLTLLKMYAISEGC